MQISKDESIITQVAAKIAADLATSVKPDTIENATAHRAIAFDVVREGIMEAHGVSTAPPVAAMVPNHIPDIAVQQVQETFPTAQVVQEAPTNMTVQVKGTQHGPLPDWLIQDAARKGVGSVWDNRDGLAANPKRPWFKSADGTKDAKGQDVAFWPPR